MPERDSRDRLLQEAFDELHRASRSRMPEFRSLWARAERGRRVARLPLGGYRAAVTVAAAAVLLVAILIGVRGIVPSPQDDLDRIADAAATIGEWRAPLDFLLETPGRQWLETTPRWAVALPLDVPATEIPSDEEVTR